MGLSLQSLWSVPRVDGNERKGFEVCQIVRTNGWVKTEGKRGNLSTKNISGKYTVGVYNKAFTKRFSSMCNKRVGENVWRGANRRERSRI